MIFLTREEWMKRLGEARNFSFLLREGGRWELAPAYDLTDTHFAEGPRSEWTDTHALAVNGKTSGIGDADLIAVAERFGIGTAPALLARVHAAAKDVHTAR